jgi:hypothetical protein
MVKTAIMSPINLITTRGLGVNMELIPVDAAQWKTDNEGVTRIVSVRTNASDAASGALAELVAYWGPSVLNHPIAPAVLTLTGISIAVTSVALSKKDPEAAKVIRNSAEAMSKQAMGEQPMPPSNDNGSNNAQA